MPRPHTGPEQYGSCDKYLPVHHHHHHHLSEAGVVFSDVPLSVCLYVCLSVCQCVCLCLLVKKLKNYSSEIDVTLQSTLVVVRFW